MDSNLSSGEYDLSLDALSFRKDSFVTIFMVGLGVVLGDGLVKFEPSEDDVLDAEVRCIFILLKR